MTRLSEIRERDAGHDVPVTAVGTCFEDRAHLLRLVDALRDVLWICTEHDSLHFGESHNTVILGRKTLKELE